MKISIKTIWRSMRRQSVLSLVTMAGTALAVFLIMVVVMVDGIRTLPFAPESARPRFMLASACMIKEINHHSSCGGNMSYETYRRLYESMTTPEDVCAYIACETMQASVEGCVPVNAEVKRTDDRFWRVFDFAFIDGAPYGKGDFDSGLLRAVISRDVARELYGTEEAAGRTIYLDDREFVVAGVVADVSPLATAAYAEVWIPMSADREKMEGSWGERILGGINAMVLARSAADFDAIREEYHAGVGRINADLADRGWRMDSVPPYPVAMAKSTGIWSREMTPEEKSASDRRRVMVYMILLIVPAINLSAMTESRLSQRTAEFGVRRAFGCTRREILEQIIVENLVVTLVAGVVGVGLSLLFAVLSGRLLFDSPVSLSMLMHWSVAAWAVGICFVLNLMSASVPAWRASRHSIVTAISGQRK